MVGVNAIAAETDDEARRLWTSQQMSFADLLRGRERFKPSLQRDSAVEQPWSELRCEGVKRVARRRGSTRGLFAILTGGTAGFQLALAIGAPWGAYAMGGAFQGKFPPLMRLAALVQAALLVLIALVVLSRAGLMLRQWEGVSSWLVWVVVAFSAVACVLNTLTPSARERRIWLPIAGVTLICSLAVVLSAEK